MAFLGLFKKPELINMKVSEVKSDLSEVELLERRLGREAASCRELMQSKRLYAQNEPNLTDDELDGLALDIEELENDIAAKNDELGRVRDEKRAMKGVLMLLERKERMKRLGVWDDISKMSPEKLEEGLQKLGDMDASVSGNVDLIRHTLGAPATPKEMRQRLTSRARSIRDELSASRDDR